MFELQIAPCPIQDIEATSDVLEMHGALSITMLDENDQPIFEPNPGETPLWQDSVILALFEKISEAEAAQQALSSVYPKLCFRLKTIPNQDWVQATQDSIHPLLFGENLWVCPSNCLPPAPDAVHVILDPGLAFGTGTHPTTAQCLTWLDGASLQEKTVIDYGCGSGILAIASLKLGAKLAYAVDIDPQALIATQNNAEKNTINPDQLLLGEPTALSVPVDILLANILLSPLLSLQHRFSSLLKPGGQLVLSGILRTQVKTLIEAYQIPNWIYQETRYEGDWALVVFHSVSM